MAYLTEGVVAGHDGPITPLEPPRGGQGFSDSLIILGNKGGTPVSVSVHVRVRVSVSVSARVKC